MNYVIHSIMYSYYSFKAFRIFIPRFIAFVITVSQIAQMFIGFYIAGYIFAQKLNGAPCKMSLNQSIFSISVYVIYFALFVNFFLRTYFKRSTPVKSEPSSTAELNGKTKPYLDENCNLSKQKVH